MSKTEGLIIQRYDVGGCSHVFKAIGRCGFTAAIRPDVRLVLIYNKVPLSPFFQRVVHLLNIAHKFTHCLTNFLSVFQTVLVCLVIRPNNQDIFFLSFSLIFPLSFSYSCVMKGLGPSAHLAVFRVHINTVSVERAE